MLSSLGKNVKVDFWLDLKKANSPHPIRKNLLIYSTFTNLGGKSEVVIAKIEELVAAHILPEEQKSNYSITLVPKRIDYSDLSQTGLLGPLTEDQQKNSSCVLAEDEAGKKELRISEFGMCSTLTQVNF